MTRTEKLLKLAEAALVIDHNERAAWYNEKELLSGTGLYFPKNARFIAAANPETIKQLVKLVRLQHEALDGLEHYLDPDMEEGYTSAFNEIVNARAAFNKFEGGE